MVWVEFVVTSKLLGLSLPGNRRLPLTRNPLIGTSLSDPNMDGIIWGEPERTPNTRKSVIYVYIIHIYTHICI